MDVTLAFNTMLNDISAYDEVRTVSDPNSPCQIPVLEAEPGRSYELRGGCHNVVRSRPLCMRWLAANILHFFASTEDAEPLLNYNKQAARFLTGTNWVGAYGAVAMPQVEVCVELLLRDSRTRRAIVSMGDASVQDINRPACWSFLQFLETRKKLDMLVYQRSLNVWSVMPYDAALLTNIHKYVSTRVGISAGSLRWTVGSLHTTATSETRDAPVSPVYFSAELLRNPKECWDALVMPEFCNYLDVRSLLQ